MYGGDNRDFPRGAVHVVLTVSFIGSLMEAGVEGILYDTLLLSSDVTTLLCRRLEKQRSSWQQ